MDEELPQLSKEELNRVGKWLRDRYAVYKKNRRATELQWLKNLRQVLGEYDPEFLKDLAPNQSRAYPKITRVKCVSMVSRLMSLLFPASEKNWSLSPSPSPSLDKDGLERAVADWQEQNPGVPITNEAVQHAVATYARKCAENMEREIEDQLTDVGEYGMADYPQLARKVIESAVKYSIGIVKGPMTLQEAKATYSVNNGQIEITQQDSYRPYFQQVSVWDYYPDMSANNFAQMEGQFQRHVFSRYQLNQLAKRDDFYGDIIRDYIRANPDGNYREDTHETELRALGDNKEAHEPGSAKFEVLEYWGQLSGKDLNAAGVNVPEGSHNDEVRATVWVLDNVVIKAAKDPFPAGTKMYHQFVFEEDEVNLCGSGLPPIVRDSQMGVANASRMLLDNAAAVCGPNVEVDYQQMFKGQDLTSIHPFKVWLTEPNPLSNRQAVRSISFDAHINELSAVVGQFRDFADAETFVGPMTGGDMTQVSGEMLRTTGGMSMAMATAALPFRDIVRNFDVFTISVIHALVQWNRIFNSKPELDGDVRPVAKGATSLMAREVRAAAMDNLANTMTPAEEPWIDGEALARQRIMARDIPVDELMVPRDVAMKRIDARDQAAQRTTELQQQLLEAQLRVVNADALKSSSQAQRNIDVGDAQTARLVLDAIVKGVDPNAIKQFVTAYTGAQSPGTAGDTRGQVGGTVPPGGDIADSQSAA